MHLEAQSQPGGKGMKIPLTASEKSTPQVELIYMLRQNRPWASLIRLTCPGSWRSSPIS